MFFITPNEGKFIIQGDLLQGWSFKNSFNFRHCHTYFDSLKVRLHVVSIGQNEEYAEKNANRTKANQDRMYFVAFLHIGFLVLRMKKPAHLSRSHSTDLFRDATPS